MSPAYANFNTRIQLDSPSLDQHIRFLTDAPRAEFQEPQELDLYISLLQQTLRNVPAQAEVARLKIAGLEAKVQMLEETISARTIQEDPST